jgi:hypothetical protein
LWGTASAHTPQECRAAILPTQHDQQRLLRDLPPLAPLVFQKCAPQPACFRDHAKGVEFRCRRSVSRCKLRHEWLVPGVPGLPGSTRAQHTDAESSTPIGRSPRSGLLAGGRRVVRGVARRDRSTLEVARCVPAVTESWSRPVVTCATWVKTLSASPDQARPPLCRGFASEKGAQQGRGASGIGGGGCHTGARNPRRSQRAGEDTSLRPALRWRLALGAICMANVAVLSTFG